MANGDRRTEAYYRSQTMTDADRLLLLIGDVDRVEENLFALAEKVTNKLNWLVGLVASLLVSVVVALVTAVVVRV